MMPTGPPVQTNDLGEFRIFSLPAGEYFIAASTRPSYGVAGARMFSGAMSGTVHAAVGSPSVAMGGATTTVMTYYPGTTDASTALGVSVAAGQVVTGVDFRLLTAPSYVVSGVVVDESNRPIAGAMLMLNSDARGPVAFGGPTGNGRSDASGRFVIAGVTAGSYLLTASIPITFSTSGSGSGSATYFASAQGRPMPRSAPLSVTVTDTNVEGLRVVVQQPQ
jgi:hypothetical protein